MYEEYIEDKFDTLKFGIDDIIFGDEGLFLLTGEFFSDTNSPEIQPLTEMSYNYINSGFPTFVAFERNLNIFLEEDIGSYFNPISDLKIAENTKINGMGKNIYILNPLDIDHFTSISNCNLYVRSGLFSYKKYIL